MAAHNDFRRRVIDWASLDKPVRRVVAFGFALLLGLAGLTALREVFVGRSEVFAVTYVVPLAALVIAGVAIAAAVALMLAGASAARSPWRFLAVLGVAALCLPLMPPTARSEAGSRSAEIAWFAVYLLGVGGSALVAFGNRLGAWHRTLALSALLVISVALIALAATLLPATTHAAEVVTRTMMIVVFLAIPAIIVVGWDLAEIASEVSATAARRWNGLAGISSLAVATSIVLAVALGAWLTAAHGLAAKTLFFRAAALGALCLLFAWWLSREQTGAARDAHSVSYFHVLFVAALIAVTTWTEVAATRDPDNVFNAHTGHRFSVELPAGWRVVHDPVLGVPAVAENQRGVTSVHLAPGGRSGVPRLSITALPLTPKTSLPPSSLKVRVNHVETVRVPLTPTRKDTLHTATTRFEDSKGQVYKLEFAHLVYDDRGPLNNVFAFTCVYRLPDAAGIEKACEVIADSFQFDARTVPYVEPRLFFNEVNWIVLALVSLIVVAVWPVAGSSVEFLIWAAIVIVVRNVGSTFGHFHHGVAQDVTLSVEVLVAALWLGALAVFVTSVEAARRQALHLARAQAAAQSFLGALTVAALFFELYVQAAEASGHSHVIRGAIICLALSWEFWTSGAMITNRDSPRYPRPARIMFYLGYLLVIASIVFFWVKLPRAAGSPQAAFEAELYVATGVVCLGLPFLLFRHFRAYLDAIRPAPIAQPAASPSDP